MAARACCADLLAVEGLRRQPPAPQQAGSLLNPQENMNPTEMRSCVQGVRESTNRKNTQGA